MLKVLAKEPDRNTTLVILENAHLEALRSHEPETYNSYFGQAKANIYPIDCDNGSGRVAATLYQSDKLIILVTGSFFIMNAPDRSKESRVYMCADFLGVKSAFVQADLMDESALTTEHGHLTSFAIQLHDPYGNSTLAHDNDAREWSAINSNSPNGYRFGKSNKRGLRALINKLSGMLNIPGIHPEIITSLFLYLCPNKVEVFFRALRTR